MTNNPPPRQAHLAFLDTVRTYELDVARQYFPNSLIQGEPCQLLELGAGTGVQASRLSALGYKVSALEVQGSSYREVRCFDIVEYDGVHIPFPDQSQDVIFSSNVLEHIVELDQVLNETYRVLSHNGVCIHLVPTSSCRAWTLLAHYVWLIRRAIQKLLATRSSLAAKEDVPRMPDSTRAWFWTLIPMRHGERGNTVTEIYYYSRHFWSKKFKDAGFEIIKIDSNSIFYTMANGLGLHLGMKHRRLLSRIIGGSCNIYVLKKKVKN
ncbi:class I SAM-dependent methyltransferase [Halopseudomonas yangmingensis]|uniref:Methyltransferase domain-containing protein n=1 Tax=Halopseudomonas yangmingensis TaxID=1720063 RepID=A0A1I4NZI5_9GAMM|nr:class I SAM-dependent methyltransferase [Halopseudomonas yangmingensis]SFM20523.1 Methyltransferase domain-containing protein [Halopseudomonas yangmingensis]